MNNDQPKLSDVLANEPAPLYRGKFSSLEREYPMIDSLKISVEEYGSRHGWYDTVTALTGKNFKEATDCHNPLCYGGGVNVNKILYGLVTRRATHHQQTYHCH